MTKVLVFESDPSFAGELRSEFGRMGCTVQVVDDGNVGLQAAATERPDLILLSIELPRMNGFSVCNKLKKDPQLKDVPLIIMSSESSDETFDQHRKLRTRAEDYVHKPIAFGELLEHIRAYIPIDGAVADSEAIVIDEIDVVDEFAADVLFLEASPMTEPPPPVAAPEEAPEHAPPSTRAPAPKADAEVDDFIGGAFHNLLGDDNENEDERTVMKPLAAILGDALVAHAKTAEESGASLGAPAPARPVPVGGAVRTFAGGSPSLPPRPASGPGLGLPRPGPAAVAPRSALGATPRPAAAPEAAAELERLRAEIEQAKREAAQHAETAAGEHASVSRLESELATAREAANEAAKLRRELEGLKRAPVSVAGAKLPGAGREVLDLREALNKKDKELLGLREQLSRRDKEVLDVRDQALALEREQADHADKVLELERAKEELEAQLEEARAAGNARANDTELATTREALAAAEAATAEAIAEGRRALTAAETDAREKLEAAVVEEHEWGERALAALSEKHAKERSSAVEALEAQLAREIADRDAGHIAALEKLGRSAAERLTARENELEAAREEQFAALSNKLESELVAERAKHTAELEAGVAELEAARRQIAELEGVRAEIATAREALGAARAQIEATEERATGLEAALATRTAELEERTAQATERTMELGERASELAKAREKLEASERDGAARIMERDGLVGDLASMTAERDRVKAEGEAVTAALAALRVELDQRTEQRDVLAVELEERVAERDGLRTDLVQRTRDRDAALADVASVREDRDRLGGELAQAQRTIESAEQREASLAAELRVRTDERDHLRAEVDRATEALTPVVAKIEASAARITELESEVTSRVDERDAERFEVERLTADLAREATKLEKARARWGDDRAALERARLALATVVSQIEEVEKLPLE